MRTIPSLTPMRPSGHRTVFLTATFTLRYAITEHRRGRTHVWSGPLSRYTPRAGSDFARQTVTDYFAPRGHSAFEKF